MDKKINLMKRNYLKGCTYLLKKWKSLRISVRIVKLREHKARRNKKQLRKNKLKANKLKLVRKRLPK